MDGDPVTDGEPAGTAEARPLRFSEIFMELCPKYMAMGMSYDEFWHRNTSCHYAYRKAYEEKRRMRNWELWLQGKYNYCALVLVAPVMRAAMSKSHVEPGEYPIEPWPLDSNDVKKREEQKQKVKFEQVLALFEKESEENLKLQREAEVAETEGTRDTQEGG